MAALTTNLIVNAGTKPTFVAAALSDSAEIGNGGNTFAVYRNTDATNAKTVTVTVPGNTSYGVAYPTLVANLIAVTGEAWIPLRTIFDDGTGRATLAVGGTGGATGVTVSVVRITA